MCLNIQIDMKQTKLYLSINSDWTFQLTSKAVSISNYFGRSVVVDKKSKPILFNIIVELIKVHVKQNLDLEKFILFINKGNAIDTNKIRDAVYELVNEDILILSPRGHNLSVGEKRRYFRQLMFWNKYQDRNRDIYDIQNNLKKAKVAVIGLGGEGGVVAAYLGSVGVGSILLIDGDLVEESNLARQVLYKHKDIGLKKSQVLKKYISEQNKYVSVASIDKYISGYSDLEIYLGGVNFIILCGDEPIVKLREWVNRYSLSNNIPHIGVSGGWVGPICVPRTTACFECEKYFFSKKYNGYDRLMKWIINKKDSRYRPAFVFRPALSGLMIAQQVVKYISGSMDVEVLKGRWNMDLGLNTYFEIIPRNTKCKLCGEI